jgi:hypothetical protein
MYFDEYDQRHRSGQRVDRQRNPERGLARATRQRELHPLPALPDELGRAFAFTVLGQSQEGDDGEEEGDEDRAEAHERDGFAPEAFTEHAVHRRPQQGQQHDERQQRKVSSGKESF